MVLRRPAPAEEKPLHPAELAAPAPGPGEVEIAVEACGVCRTDLHILEGEVPASLPLVPGHQAAGRIAAVGAGVADFSPGEAVGVGWMASTCGRCAFCASGRENLCASARFTGRDRDGGYAERLIADARWAYRCLPASLRSRRRRCCAPESSAIAPCGCRASRRAGASDSSGSGPRRTSRSRLRKSWGCEVYAFTREARHRELALGMGAAWSGEATRIPA